MKYFVVSDIHGKEDELNIILEMYNPEEETLVFLGDYIDRGYKNIGVLETIMTMQLLHGRNKVKVLRGNHDALFLDALTGDEGAYATWIMNGGVAVLEEVLAMEEPKDQSTPTPSAWCLPQKDMISLCTKHLLDKIEFLKNRTLLYYQDTSFLFTHAGFNYREEDWRNTKASDFLWIRKHYFKPNKTGLINVFGHTRTTLIRGVTGDNSVWVSPCKTYIGIDGGCAYGGQLNAVVLDSNNLKEMRVYVAEARDTEVQVMSKSLE